MTTFFFQAHCWTTFELIFIFITCLEPTGEVPENTKRQIDTVKSIRQQETNSKINRNQSEPLNTKLIKVTVLSSMNMQPVSTYQIDIGSDKNNHWLFTAND